MIYILTMGEYSSYEILDAYEGPEDFDQAAAKKEWDEADTMRERSTLVGLETLGQARETIIRHWLESHGFKLLEWQEIDGEYED